MNRKPHIFSMLAMTLLCVVAFLWAAPFLWMFVASIRPEGFGGLRMASIWPDFSPTLDNFALAFKSANFALYYFNTFLMAAGILLVQMVTIMLAGYAFARLEFPFKNTIFYAFLIQLMLVPPILIVPNLSTLVMLHLNDSLLGVMAPYFASAFGVFLMRQSFKSIPKDFEDAAIIDGCSWYQLIWYVLLPLSRPTLVAFAIVSVVFHWNEFLWPLMVITSPEKQVLTVGLASFTLGAEGASEWGLIAAGTVLVSAPLLIVFVAFQRQFVNSFVSSGIK
ncbi:MAG: carbohydrate ABC transporter permease [Paracoccaceae bacterium]